MERENTHNSQKYFKTTLLNSNPLADKGCFIILIWFSHSFLISRIASCCCANSTSVTLAPKAREKCTDRRRARGTARHGTAQQSYRQAYCPTVPPPSRPRCPASPSPVPPAAPAHGTSEPGELALSEVAYVAAVPVLVAGRAGLLEGTEGKQLSPRCPGHAAGCRRAQRRKRLTRTPARLPPGQRSRPTSNAAGRYCQRPSTARPGTTRPRPAPLCRAPPAARLPSLPEDQQRWGGVGVGQYPQQCGVSESVTGAGKGRRWSPCAGGP